MSTLCSALKFELWDFSLSFFIFIFASLQTLEIIWWPGTWTHFGQISDHLIYSFLKNLDLSWSDYLRRAEIHGDAFAVDAYAARNDIHLSRIIDDLFQENQRESITCALTYVCDFGIWRWLTFLWMDEKAEHSFEYFWASTSHKWSCEMLTMGRTRSCFSPCSSSPLFRSKKCEAYTWIPRNLKLESKSANNWQWWLICFIIQDTRIRWCCQNGLLHVKQILLDLKYVGWPAL